MLKRIALIVVPAILAVVLSIVPPTVSAAQGDSWPSHQSQQSTKLISPLSDPLFGMLKKLPVKAAPLPPTTTPVVQPVQPNVSVSTSTPVTTTTVPVPVVTPPTAPAVTPTPTTSSTTNGVGPDVSGTWGSLAQCEEGGADTYTFGYFGFTPKAWDYTDGVSTAGQATLAEQEAAVLAIEGHIPYAPWNCLAGGYTGW